LLLLIFLLFWGFVAAADSPMFSALIAKNAPPESRGTSLTIVNCIGFATTIISIQFLSLISAHIDVQYLYMILAAGPAAGLLGLLTKKLKGA
jgi:MFS family permease